MLAKCAGDTLELSVFGIETGNRSVREIKLDHLAKSMSVNTNVVKWKGILKNSGGCENFV